MVVEGLRVLGRDWTHVRPVAALQRAGVDWNWAPLSGEYGMGQEAKYVRATTMRLRVAAASVDPARSSCRTQTNAGGDWLLALPERIRRPPVRPSPISPRQRQLVMIL